MTLAEVEFAWGWALWLLPLPLLAYFAGRGQVKRSAPLMAPFAEDFRRQGSFSMGQAKGFSWWRLVVMLLAAVAWCCLVAAAMRPQELGPAQPLPSEGRNLMLAVDLSGSMREQDMIIDGYGRVNRLQAVKIIAGDFIERREGDRVGLILFGDRAYLQSPLSFDRATVNKLLQEAELGLLGRRTAIGDAIGLAIKQLPEEGADSSGEQVLILLTDGASTAGSVSPLEAASYAGVRGLKIYAVGIGRAGRGGGYVDVDTMTRVSAVTGGQFFMARNSGELARVYREIDRLEPAAAEREGFRPRYELYVWPLSVAALLAAVMSLCWPWLEPRVRQA